MQFSTHFNITADALKRWFIAQCYDSLAVGALWWVGLMLLHVPWAPLLAIVAAICQFIPQFGFVFAFIGPALAALLVSFDTFLYVLILYGAIVVLDGLVLQPLIMRRTARVPFWASLIVPILLAMLLGFWGVLLAAPLLAIVFAYRALAKSRRAPAQPLRKQQTPPGQPIQGGVLISPGESSPRIEAPE